MVTMFDVWHALVNCFLFSHAWDLQAMVTIVWTFGWSSFFVCFDKQAKLEQSKVLGWVFASQLQDRGARHSYSYIDFFVKADWHIQILSHNSPPYLYTLFCIANCTKLKLLLFTDTVHLEAVMESDLNSDVNSVTSLLNIRYTKNNGK